MKIRKTELKPDKFGNYVRELGYVDSTKKKQYRFNLGKDRQQAEERIARLMNLLDDSAAICQGVPVFTNFAILAARLIERGEILIPYGPTQKVADSAEARFRLALDYVWKMRKLREQFPSLVIVPSDPDFFAEGEKYFEDFVDTEIKKVNYKLTCCKAVESGKSLPQNVFPGNFHEALDRFADQVKETCTEGQGILTAWGSSQLAHIERLKEHHPDFMLMFLDADCLEQMVAYWRNVPMTKRNTPMAPSTIKNHLKVLKLFLKWLHRRSHYPWRAPDNFNELGWAAKKNTRSKKLMQVGTFSPEELAVLNKYARPKERLILLLGLNCGFAPSELGTLRINEIYLRQPHPEAKRIKWLADNDSYIRRSRRKTGIWGEFVLWNQTVELLEKYIARRFDEGATKDDLLFVGKTGEPVYQNGRGRYYTGHFFSNPWTSLIKRIRLDHPEFSSHSIGKLRKTGGDLVREHGNSDLASMFLTHGKTSEDDLLEVYSNRPFAKLFGVLKELEIELADVFTAANKESPC